MAIDDENPVNNDNPDLYVDLGSRGRYCRNNQMNTLTGKEWLQFTRTWFVLKPKRRTQNVLQHPAKFPEELVERYVSFFTKPGEIVLDPMAGTGTVNEVCEAMGRVGYGVELEQAFYDIAKGRSNQVMIRGDCRDLEKYAIPQVDFIITSPPYWDSLKMSHKRQVVRKERNLQTDYGNSESNFGNIGQYQNFVNELVEFYAHLRNWLKPNKYIVIIVNNIYKNGHVYPLAFELAIRLSKYYLLKDEQVWCQEHKRLMVFGINVTYVGNRHHNYCLLFQKSDNY